ncbi:MAG: hypothetical protein A2946_03520 [Candidatus Liptonbacteria bacterium RIFCSPLOWO2_01_FULL_53_13]|uniref:Uncharacterized protein n=1 Tax=Candidatus Liptonbacteria bacterium RIFCSPLOWO2_01_FULL_53_13 TaxID=1798651 RepID=A0A1G2CJ08_9BACT|nr:MAG: hypothetical protein A2946_03520 [Candidatus Liptonbacteria bacterium RIFCSPLOWO2_01_FULL_53_13]
MAVKRRFDGKSETYTMKGMKKASKKGENGTGVLLEHIDSKLDVVVEGQHSLQNQISSNHEEFREFRREVDYKFETVFDELRIIRNDLKEKVGRDEFMALEKRLVQLEKKSSHSLK